MAIRHTGAVSPVMHTLPLGSAVHARAAASRNKESGRQPAEQDLEPLSFSRTRGHCTQRNTNVSAYCSLQVGEGHHRSGDLALVDRIVLIAQIIGTESCYPSSFLLLLFLLLLFFLVLLEVLSEAGAPELISLLSEGMATSRKTIGRTPIGFSPAGSVMAW